MSVLKRGNGEGWVRDNVSHFQKVLPAQLGPKGAEHQQDDPFRKGAGGKSEVRWGREEAEGSHFRSCVFGGPHPHAFLQAAAEVLVHLHTRVWRPTCGVEAQGMSWPWGAEDHGGVSQCWPPPFKSMA